MLELRVCQVRKFTVENKVAASFFIALTVQLGLDTIIFFTAAGSNISVLNDEPTDPVDPNKKLNTYEVIIEIVFEFMPQILVLFTYVLIFFVLV